MVRILHWNAIHTETVGACELSDLISVIIGHEERSFGSRHEAEQFLVVYVVKAVQPFACFLSARGVRWVDKKDSPRVTAMLRYDVKTIFLEKLNSSVVLVDEPNTSDQRLRIPA